MLIEFPHLVSVRCVETSFGDNALLINQSKEQLNRVGYRELSDLPK